MFLLAFSIILFANQKKLTILSLLIIFFNNQLDYMKYLNSEILELHPNDHSESILKFIIDNWSGSKDIQFAKGYGAGKEPLNTLIYEIFIQGWTKGLDRYLNATMCDLQDAISLRKQFLMKEISMKNSDLSGTDSLARKNIEKRDTHFNADISLQVLNKMLIKLKRGQMHADKMGSVIHDSSTLTSEKIFTKFTGFKNLSPFKLRELLNSHPGQKTLIEQLSDPAYSKKIDAFEGFSFLETPSKFCLAHELSAPVVAWKMAENSLPPLNQLVVSIISYGYNLRLHYNHYSFNEQISQTCNI